jgi:hypothetical protein
VTNIDQVGKRGQTTVQPAGEEGDKKTYSWSVAVAGPPEKLKNLIGVTYVLPKNYSPRLVARNDPATRFALASSEVEPKASAEPVPMEVLLTTKSGVQLDRIFLVPAGQSRTESRRDTGPTVSLPDVPVSIRRPRPCACSASVSKRGCSAFPSRTSLRVPRQAASSSSLPDPTRK